MISRAGQLEGVPDADGTELGHLLGDTTQNHRLGRVACPRSSMLEPSSPSDGAAASHPSRPVILRRVAQENVNITS